MFGAAPRSERRARMTTSRDSRPAHIGMVVATLDCNSARMATVVPQ
jgi:hypothetical protein